MKTGKRLLSAFLALSMVSAMLPTFAVNAYARTVYPAESAVISEEIKNSGEFYVATPNINMVEGSGTKYAATIKRGGDNLEAASVRLTLLDITAQYGKDYTIEVPDKGFFERDVENKRGAKSIYALARENDGKLDEVNGLDEIAAMNMTDEEIQEMYDESVEALSEDLSVEIQEYVEEKAAEAGLSVEEVLEALNEDSKAQETVETYPDEPVEAADEAIEDALQSSEAEGALQSSEAVIVVPEKKSSLSEAFEEATGLKDDSAPMDGGTFDGSAIIGEYSRDKLEELAKQLDSPYIVLDFAEGETEKTIEIIPKDNGDAEGNKMFLVNLFPESDNAVISEFSGITAVIEDDEKWSEPTVEFAESVYYPENGFADITIRRDGVLTDVAAVKLTTSDGTAMGGRDYSKVDTTVVFPFGINERTIKVPVSSEYIDSTVNFNLTLSDAQNCTLGANFSALGIVEADSVSYKVEDEQAQLMGEDASVSSVIVSDKEALDHQNPYSSSAGDNGYARAEGNNYVLYASTTWADKVWSRAYWNTKDQNSHYDYDGYQIDWTKDSGKPCYTNNEVQIYYGGSWHTVWENEDDRWGKTTTNIYPKQNEFQKLKISVSQNWGYLSKAVTLKIHSIKPILRPFEVTLDDADKLQFRNENGDYVDYDNINKLSDAIGAKLIGANREGTGTAVKFSGEQITVTTDSSYVYISGIKIVHPTNGSSKVIKSGLPVGTQSVSISLTNDFIKKNLDYINFTSNGGNRIKGQFHVKPIFGYYDTTITLHNDKRASLSLNDFDEDKFDPNATYMIKVPGEAKFISGKEHWAKRATLDTSKDILWRFVQKDGGWYEIENVTSGLPLCRGSLLMVDHEKLYAIRNNSYPDFNLFGLEKQSDGTYVFHQKPMVNWTSFYISRNESDDDLVNGTADSPNSKWELVKVELPQEVSKGVYILENDESDGKYLMTASGNEGSTVRCEKKEPDDKSKWEFIYVDDTYCKIKNVYNGLLLTPRGVSAYSVNTFVLQPDHHEDSQLFKIEENKFIRPKISDCYVRLEIYNVTGGAYDKWNIIQVEGPETDNSNSGDTNYSDTVTFTVHKGDTVLFTQNIRNAYKDTYGSSTLKIVKRETTDAAEDKKYAVFNYGKNSYRMLCDSAVIDVYADTHRLDSEVIVRVSEKDVSRFDESIGIFTKPYVRNGSYREYTVVPKDKFTLEYVELEAKPKNDNYVPIWTPANDQKSYSQQTFYFETQMEKEDNVIGLYATTGEKEKYVIAGTAHYSEVALAGQTEGEAWRPADGLFVSLGKNCYGISDKDGNFITTPFRGSGNKYVICKTEDNGRINYVTVQLKNEIPKDIDNGNGGTEKVQVISIGDVKASVTNSDVPHASAFIATNMNGVMNGRVALISDDITYMTATIMNNGAVYTDTDGKERTESVKKVEFVIYDYMTNRVKSVVDGDAKEIVNQNGMSVWQMAKTFKKDESYLYSSSDKIYIRVTTDRVKGNGKVYDEKGDLVELDALNETTYPDVFTGYTLATTNTEMPVTYDVDILDTALDQFLTLPVIGSMNSTFLIKNISLSISQLPESGFRLSLGYAVGVPASKADDAEEHKVPFSPGRISEEFDKVKQWGQVVGGEPKGSFGLSGGGLYPTFGIYLDFGVKSVKHLDDKGSQQTDLVFLGGGAMIGAVGKYRIVLYGAIGPVPVYFGVDGQLTVFANIGVKVKNKDTLGDDAIEYKDVTFEEIKSGDKNIEDAALFDFALQAHGLLNVYVGAGIAGTLGVRGGASIGASLIYYPTITQTYDINPVGLQITVGLKIWVDLVLFSIPSPELNLTNKRYGYYEDIDKLNENNPSLMSVGEQTMVSTDEYGAFLRKGSGKDEVWLPDKDAAQLMSTFEMYKTTVLSKDGYENASPQLMDLGDGRILLVYLANDTEKGDYDRTSLVYNVYDNGQWSTEDSVKIDPSSTKADFEPNLCDIGDKILISWTSRSNDDNRTDSADYLKGMNVFSTTIDKDTLAIGEIEQLTNDDYYNAYPVGLYDEVTGDYAVYYLKSEVTDVDTGDTYEDSVDSEAGANLLTIASPTTNGAKLMYRLHNDTTGWVTDKLSNNESAMATGERFVVSQIEELSGTANSDSPRIIDFTAASYDGNGVYAYTIDLDNNIDTMADRELYVQIYDFAAHKTYKPIRITNDTLADSEPQLVRNGEQTYLFWREGESTIRYIDIANLVTNGLEDNETLKDQNADGDGTTAVYEVEQSRVFSTMENPDMTPSFANYKVFVDKDGNMFIAWTQGEEQSNEDGTLKSTCTEVYASAFIKETETVGSEETALDASWSEGMCLTKSGRYNDGIAVWTNADGNLITVNNQYDIDDEKSEAINIELVATEYKTVGSAEINDVRYNDTTPLAGSKDTVTIDVKNKGLKAMNGFTLKAYEVKNGVVSDTPVFETTSTERVTPSSVVPVDFDWQMPDSFSDIDTLSLHITIQETGYEKINEYDSESIELKAEYVLHNIAAVQSMYGFIVRYEVENTGNVDEDSDIY